MELNKNLYIEPRHNENHVNLDGKWEFAQSDCQAENLGNLAFDNIATLPKSVGWCLYEDGVLPHPYENCNSSKYTFIHHKVWYFRRRFTVPETAQKNRYAYLCFDGVSYYSRVWLNGKLLGDHEGMFGGPVIEVHDILNYCGDNEIVVECTPCNMDYDDVPLDTKDTKETYSQLSSFMDTNVIAPWALMNDSLTSNGDFTVVGIWRSVRIEFLPAYHMNNPYIFTESIGDKSATLQLEVPITNPFMREEIGVPGSRKNDWHGYEWITREVTTEQLTNKYTEEDIKIQIKISAPDGTIIADEINSVTEYDLSMLGNCPCADYTFFRKEIQIDNPKLWSPLDSESQPLYKLELTLLHNNEKCDYAEIPVGIRTVEVVQSAGTKFQRTWAKFQFVVNGENVFLKGMNFTELDQMLLENDREYEWVLRLAKNDGIQLIRIWSGGGVPESETFYRLCDELGIMVWQDSLLANNTSRFWDTNVLRSQVSYYLYRIRNHASFVLHCGGNEFNPYSKYNAASMFAIRNETDILAPDRIFYNATPDGGDVHGYWDMEPTWNRHIYKRLPLLSESGIHGFPTIKTMRGIIKKEETVKPIDDILNESFPELFPELRNHFSEFNPWRVPRMLSRASHFTDMNGVYLNDLCEASHMSSYENYLIMIESMLENYPVTTGIMPWVYKRPWPTTAIQIVDGCGNPCWQYYAIKRAYEKSHPIVSLEHLNFKAGERVEMPIKLFSEIDYSGSQKIELEIFDYCLSSVTKKEIPLIDYQKGINDIDEISFEIPNDWQDVFFFVRVQLTEKEGIKGESLYFPKVLSMLNDEEKYKAERTWPCQNHFFEKGPWLKKQVSELTKTFLECEITNKEPISDGYVRINLSIRNMTDTPAFPVVIDTEDIKSRLVCSDNIFMLAGGEEREVEIIVDIKQSDSDTLTVGAWNTNYQTI